MTERPSHFTLSRRALLTAGGGALAAAAGVQLLSGVGRSGLLSGPRPADAAAAPADLHLVGTDGWIYLPGTIPGIQPDALAPGPRTTYIFGFRNVTGLSDSLAQAQKNHAQASAPLIWADQESALRIRLSNLGLTQRPDLTDSHTIHFHGFRNAIPLFDGVPEMSIAVPIGRDFTYYYMPHEPGTYMYHCHFEDVEHVQMGMTGIVYVRPRQNQGASGIPVARVAGGPSSSPLGYVYNDGVAPGQPTSTAYDREFGLFLSEVWVQAHWNDAHIQVTDWSEYAPDYWLLNGRVYPYTTYPNGGGNNPTTGDPIAPAGYPELQYQPLSSLITANSGDRVLLRLVNLGYRQAAMTLGGLSMRVVGKDATLLKARDGTDLSYTTNTVYLGPGESVDAIFVAPSVSAPTTFQLYNRDFTFLSNAGGDLGGQMTEVRISPSGLPAQIEPNT